MEGRRSEAGRGERSGDWRASARYDISTELLNHSLSCSSTSKIVFYLGLRYFGWGKFSGNGRLGGRREGGR